MKVHIFIFTCERDADILKYCLLSLHELKKRLNEPDRLKVTLVFDKSERQPESSVYALAGMGVDDIRYSTFARKGNLNGSECVAGMLTTMVDYSADDTYWLCQLDSDCILQDFNYFKAIKGELGGEALGFSDALGPRFACAGPGLCISRNLARKIASLAKQPKYAKRIDRGPGYSDTVIGALAEIAGYRCHCLPYESAPYCPGSNAYKARVALYYNSEDGTPDEAFAAMSAIVHFDHKNAALALGSDKFEDRHKRVLEDMKRWYEERVK